MDQQRIVDVLLNNACFLRGASIVLYNLLQLVPLFRNLDAHTSIGALARLGNPDVVRVLVFFVILPERLKVGVVKALLHVESDW